MFASCLTAEASSFCLTRVQGSAAELLALLVQSSPINQKLLGVEDGIDLLLQVAAQYRNKDPEEGNEDEEG